MSKKKIIIISSLVVLLLGGSVAGIQFGGIYDFTSMFDKKESEEVTEVAKKEPHFYPLKEFIISLKQPGRARFLQIEMSLMSYDASMEDQAKELETVIRNTMLKYFSGKDQKHVHEELSDIQTLQESLKDALLEASKTYDQSLPLEKVLLTNIIVQ